MIGNQTYQVFQNQNVMQPIFHELFQKLLKLKSPNDVILYDIIFLPLIWNSTVWGSSYKTYLKEIEVMQKKAVRAITNNAYNANTNVLFKVLHVLKLTDIYKL